MSTSDQTVEQRKKRMEKSGDIRDKLRERKRKHDVVTVEDALAASVDTDEFYSLIGCISSVNIRGDEVDVSFTEPVPARRTNLGKRYLFTVSVGRDGVSKERNRAGMPRKELLTMQQIAIICWTMATGEIY